MKNVALFVGSLRRDSINKKLADNLERLGADWFTFTHVRLGDVPMFNQDLENNLPPSVALMKQQVVDADAVLFVTPEYNRSLPAVLKNAIDWCSRPPGTSVWGGKAATLCGISGGAVGTAVAQSQLKSTMLMLGMAVWAQPELYLTARPGFFDDTGTITDAGTEKFLKGFLERFAHWVETVTGV